MIDLALYLSSLGHTYVLPYRTLTILLTVSFHLRSSFMSHDEDTYPNLDSPQPIKHLYFLVSTYLSSYRYLASSLAADFWSSFLLSRSLATGKRAERLLGRGVTVPRYIPHYTTVQVNSQCYVVQIYLTGRK